MGTMQRVLMSYDGSHGAKVVLEHLKRHRALKNARRIALEAREALHADCPGWEMRAESAADAPAWGLIKRAGEWRADLIVIGPHGRSALGRLVAGIVSGF